MRKTPPYPFVKWAGGKARMAAHILPRLPDSIGTYYEPMVGGGAIFIELAKSRRFKRAVLNDMNQDVMNAWSVIKSSVHDLVKELKKKRYKYERASYLRIRDEDPGKMDPVRMAARFIYLNRTCFNGLYRVNRAGKFNVPFGSYENPTICDTENLLALSGLMGPVELTAMDFEDSVRGARGGDAVYFDPPYVPTSATSSFTAYTGDRFDVADHLRLAALMDRLGKAGVRAVTSNSAAEASLEMFGRFDMDRLSGTRSIGGPAEYRKRAGEIVAFTGPRS